VQRLKRYAMKPSKSMPNIRRSSTQQVISKKHGGGSTKNKTSVYRFQFQIPHGSITGTGETQLRLRAHHPVSDLLQTADERYRSIILVHHGKLIGLEGDLDTPIGLLFHPSSYSSPIIPLIVMPMADALKGSQYALLLKYLEAGFEKLPSSSSHTMIPPISTQMDDSALTMRIIQLRNENPSWSFLRAMREAKKSIPPP
jgi:hypothetical protein